MAWYGYVSECAGASRGETISNCDSSKLGRSSYDESPDVRGTESAPSRSRGGEAAMSLDGARDPPNESVDETLGRCWRVAPPPLRALRIESCDCRLAERD